MERFPFSSSVSDYFAFTDLLLGRHACSAIYKLAQSEKRICLVHNHLLFTQIQLFLTSNFKNMDTSQWIPLCEQGMNVVYSLSEQPNSFSEALLKELSQLSNFQGKIYNMKRVNQLSLTYRKN